MMAMPHFPKCTKLHLPLPLLYFLTITLLIYSSKSQQTPPPTTSTDPSYYYNLCAPSTCNNLSLSYPFTLPTLCHPTPLQVLCPNNKHLLLMNPRTTDTFRVLSIGSTDPNTISTVIASDSLFTCGAQVSRQYFVNAGTLFTLPLRYTYGSHFNCTSPVSSDSIRGLQNASCIGCNGQDPSNVCYYAPGFVTAPAQCETYHIFVPSDSFNVSSVRDLRAYLQSGFEVRYNMPDECSRCQASGGRCGARPSSLLFVCFCPSSVHPMNCSDGMAEDLSAWVTRPGKGGSGRSKAVVAVISASASVLIIGVLIALVVIFVHRNKHKFYFNQESISSISPTRYSYSQLKKFTNNFTSKLGEGGFGSVYKGTINRSRVEVPVAVKILKRSRQTKRQFMNEVATIGSIHHHNLVCMLGYCVESETYALIYEFMENGSLEKYIYNIKKGKDGVEDESGTDYKRLSFKQVYNLALETARGILYLHKGCSKKILHCDIKPSNVLLDSNFSAKVADFGLARMIDKDHSHFSVTGAQGTPGYSAPEMWLKSCGPVTEKSDVYSYGMLLLEMAGRRKNYDAEASSSSQVYFPEWMYNKVERDEFPLRMRKTNCDTDDSFELAQDEEKGNEEDEKAVQRMCLVGLWCIQHVASNRPSMDRVVKMLEGHVEIGIPPHPFPQNTNKIHKNMSPVVVTLGPD